MSDIRNWEAFKQSRWAWESRGYERALHGKCGFGDWDAWTERNGWFLFIETKHRTRDQVGGYHLKDAQRIGIKAVTQLLHPNEAGGNAVTALAIWGDATADDPQRISIWVAGAVVGVYDTPDRAAGHRLLAAIIGEWASWAEMDMQWEGLTGLELFRGLSVAPCG